MRFGWPNRPPSIRQTIILGIAGAGAPFLASAQDKASRIPEQTQAAEEK